jgi:preprotein translocase subunit SecG
MLTVLLTILYAVVCIFLIMVVLLQTGKRADLAGAFGGGGSQTAFGARGAATLLTKLTTISAVLFMLLALTLSIISSHRSGGGSVLEEVEASDAPAPITPPPAEGLPGTPADQLPQTAPIDPPPPAP